MYNSKSYKTTETDEAKTSLGKHCQTMATKTSLGKASPDLGYKNQSRKGGYRHRGYATEARDAVVLIRQ